MNAQERFAAMLTAMIGTEGPDEMDIDPFAYLWTDPPPDTEWTDDDVDRLGDLPDMTMVGW